PTLLDLALVGKGSEESVSASNIARNPVVVDFQVRRTGDGDWLPWRNGKCMSLDLSSSAALPLNRLHLGRSRAVHFDAESSIVALVECDPCRSYTQDLTKQGAKIGNVTAVGSGKDALQGSPLLVVTTLVQIERDLPLTVLHVARYIGDQCRI